MTGVLDIAKCLYDAVSRLERAAERDGGSGGMYGTEAAEGTLQRSFLAELGRGKSRGKTGKAAVAVSPNLIEMDSTLILFSLSQDVRAAGNAQIYAFMPALIAGIIYCIVGVGSLSFSLFLC